LVAVVTHEHTTATKDSVAQPTSDTINYYTWWDSAQQSYTDYTPDTSHPGTVYATDYNYDKRGYLTDASISDGAPRDVAYTNGVNGEILENNDNKSSSPATKFFWFDGIQQGDVSNDGTSDTDYVQSIAQHTTKPGTGFFQNGATTPTAYADFDAAYDPINGLDSHETPATRYTVSQGDTLESIAQAVWGDANFWYLIADSNGIQSDDQLVSGMDLIIPDKVANASNSSSTFRVYDPNLALGNTSPTHPPKPQSHHGGCGVLGEVLLAVVAVAVTVVTAGAAVAALTPGMSLIGGMGAFVTGSAVADVGVAGMVGIGAAAGAAGSIASQGIGVATGLQSKFNWGAVGLAAVGGAVGGGLQAVGAFSDMAESIGSFGVGALRGITGSLITQGIGVATGLQSKFDWAGVAAAGVGSGVGNWVGSELNGVDYGFGDVLNKATTRLVSGMAGDIANAASRTLVNGSDFGDNILLALPSTIVQTVGAAYADYENQVQATNGLNGDLTGATVKTTPVDVSELPPVVDSEGATPDAAPATTAVSNPQQANATSNLAGTSSGDSLIEPAGANGPVLSRSDQIIAATAAGYSAEQIATSIDSGLHFVPNAEGSGSWLDGSNVETVIVTSPPSHPGAWGGTAWALDYISKAIDGGQASRAAVLSVLKIGASPVERRLFNIMVSSLDKRLGVASYALTVASDFASAQASIQAGADPAEAYAHAAGHSGASISGGIIGGLIGGAAAGPPGAVIGAAIGSEAPDVHIPDEVKILFPALLIPDIVQASADDLGAYLKSKGW
jgi:LysM repeat protein